MASQQSTPVHHTNAWITEQQTIGNKLGLLMPQRGFKDGLVNIISHVVCYTYKIRLAHPRVAAALDHISHYAFPKDMEDYYQSFRFREWEYVCEVMLVAVRLKRLVPNEFQQFMLGLYIFEYH